MDDPTSNLEGDLAYIAVMGATGSGKTLFVNSASGSRLEVGDSREPCTAEVELSKEFKLDGRRVVLIDTPGFESTIETKATALQKIAAFLEMGYSAGMRLTGIVYIHRISDDMLGGSVARDFQMFRELCGEATMKNVVLMTNMWGRVTPLQGTVRERQLQNKHFKPAIAKGATLLRYEDTPESAQEILRTILHKESVVLKIQQELVDEHKQWTQTGVAVALDGKLREAIEKHSKEAERLRERMLKAMNEAAGGFCVELDVGNDSAEEVEKLKRLVAEMRATDEGKEEVYTELDGEKKKLEGEVEKRDGVIKRLEEEKEELRGELDEEKRNSRRMTEKHDKEIERLERGMRAMEELRGELDKGKKNLEKEVKRLEGYVVEMEAKDKEQEELRRELDEEKENLEEEVEKLKRSVVEMWAEILKERQSRKGWGLMERFGLGATGGATDKIPYGVGRDGRGSSEASRTRRVVSVRRTFDRLESFDRSSTDFGDRLNEVLHTQRYKAWVSTLEKDDLMWFINYLDTALESLDPSTPASRKCMRELKTICRTHSILPTSYAVSPNLTVKPDRFAFGGYASVHEGTLGSTKVCVKRVWLADKDAQLKSTQMVCEEAVMWKYLDHQNVLRLLCASVSPPQLVSPLKAAGNLSEYLKENPGARGLRLLSEVAEGLYYLHSRNVIHGDLKGINVLVDVVDNTPHALLADFGIAIVTQNPHSIQDPTCQGGYSLRWTAPEVLKGKNPSKESDVFSFAMVAIEVFSGQLPFTGKPDQAVGVSILSGERPNRPDHLSCTNDLWIMIRRCWDEDHLLRPEMPEVRRYFAWASQN